MYISTTQIHHAPGGWKVGSGFPGTEVINDYKMACGCWELNKVPLQKTVNNLNH